MARVSPTLPPISQPQAYQDLKGDFESMLDEPLEELTQARRKQKPTSYSPFAGSLSVLLKQQMEDEEEYQRQLRRERERQEGEEVKALRRGDINEWSRVERIWELEKAKAERDMNKMRKLEEEREAKHHEVNALLTNEFNVNSREGDVVARQPPPDVRTIGELLSPERLGPGGGDSPTHLISNTPAEADTSDQEPIRLPSPRITTAQNSQSIADWVGEKIADVDPLESGVVSSFDVRALIRSIHDKASLPQPAETEMDTFLSREFRNCGVPANATSLQTDDVWSVVRACGGYRHLQRGRLRGKRAPA